MSNEARRVVVVTGGAAGIGAAIAGALGREGAFVVTMDPVVSLDGAQPIEIVETTTAERIVDAGGAARASNVSVTDAAAVADLFGGLVDEFGSLDAVVNVAGISRPTGFATGDEDDWAAVLSVHLDGYRNVLRAALPIMEQAGYGRILGVTSGSGWRAANAGAYSCAKRAVAALTWQIARSTPSGVTVNALSPIAVTRMVTAAMPRTKPGSAGSAASGGLSLGSMPPPDNLGPIGAYLAGDDFGWANGRVMFSSGAEVALITEPHLLEVVRTRDAASVRHVLDEAIPAALAPAEEIQASRGGGNPRLGAVFDEPAVDETAAETPPTCLVVADDADWRDAIRAALVERGINAVEPASPSDDASGFAAAAGLVEAAAEQAGGLDAIVVARRGISQALGGHPSEPTWPRILEEHADIATDLRLDAAWARAAADYAETAERSVRLSTVVDATSSGGRSRAQAAAQLARAADGATRGRVAAFAVSVEEPEPHTAAALVAHLTGAPDAATLSGAELVAGSGWIGLRAHPQPTGSISFGGPDLPGWLDDALRQVCLGDGVGR